MLQTGKNISCFQVITVINKIVELNKKKENN